MPLFKFERYASYRLLDAFRYRLAERDALIPLAIIGLLSGVVTAVVIALFLIGIEASKSWLLATLGGSTIADAGASAVLGSAIANRSADFETLQGPLRFALVLGGAALLGVIFQLLKPATRSTGLNHTLITLHKAHAEFPASNFFLQFFAGIIALASGQSGGREGPGVHLGAAASTLLAARFKLPNNSLRVLTACGAAAAIGAAFNTPVAGVIFAMEVIVLEYTLVGFLPVLMAAVSATLISNALFGREVVFSIEQMAMSSALEIPVFILLGICCALASISFITIQRWSAPLQKLPVFWRFTMVGLVTASLGLVFPQILGMGFDSIHQLLGGSWLAPLLLAICAVKILATALSSAAGMPIGIIGPSLFIGATLGAGLAELGNQLLFGQSPVFYAQFYALLAMGGVMSALLNAPLAAVVAVMELSGTTDTLLPGVLVVVVANLFASQVFRQRSANEILLAAQGIALESRPVAQALNRSGLAAILNDDCLSLDAMPSAAELSVGDEQQLVIAFDNHCHLLFKGSALMDLLNRAPAEQLDGDISSVLNVTRSLGIPALELDGISISCTVEQARAKLKKSDADGLFAYDKHGPRRGIILRQDLANYIERC